MRIAYLVNHYPAVSHSFIRREIAALERQGLKVERIAIRGWCGVLADDADVRERERTRFVLQHGVLPLVASCFASLLRRPCKTARAFALACRMTRGSDHSLPFHVAYFLEACHVAGWLRRTRATHVHAHFGTNSAEVAMLASMLACVGYSFTVHGPDEFDRPRAIGLTQKAHRAAFVVAISSFTRSQLFRWVELSHWGRIHVVRCGLDHVSLHADDIARAQPDRLVCVGRLSEQKGHLLLLAAMREVFDRGITFELVLAGDGELRNSIEAQVALLGLVAHVRITGWLSGGDVQTELLAARALVLPSFAEGLPVVIMESMALSRPVIATWVAGIPELVEPGRSGWLTPAGDRSALADAIVECLAASTDELARMGKYARARVLECHNVDAEASKLAALFSRYAVGSEAERGA